MFDIDKIVKEYKHVNTCMEDQTRYIKYFAEENERLRTLFLNIMKKMPKWHIFHYRSDEDKTVVVDTVPDDGEYILVYRKDWKIKMHLGVWDTNGWYYHGCFNGDPFVPGDAWIELPKPPGEESTQRG